MDRTALLKRPTFRGKKILIVGDLIIDAHHFGRPLSALTEGVVFGAEALRTEFSWGGAGLLVKNILALGGKVVFISRVGTDRYREYADDFTYPRLTKCFIAEPKLRMTVKERFWIGSHKVMKWNHLDNRSSRPATENSIIRMVRKFLPSCDTLVVSDYRHGLITRKLARRLVETSHQFKKPLYLDSQIGQRAGNHSWYKKSDLVCLNKKEAMSIDKKFSLNYLKDSLARISKGLQVLQVVVKLGKRGSAAYISGSYLRTPAPTVKAVDPTGAGDAFLAALALSEYPPTPKSLAFANRWAAISTTAVGTELPNSGNLKINKVRP